MKIARVNQERTALAGSESWNDETFRVDLESALREQLAATGFSRASVGGVSVQLEPADPSSRTVVATVHIRGIVFDGAAPRGEMLRDLSTRLFDAVDSRKMREKYTAPDAVELTHRCGAERAAQIRLPAERVYYAASPAEPDRLLCWFPRSDLKRLVDKGLAKKSVLENYPDGLEIQVSIDAFDDVGVRPPLDPGKAHARYGDLRSYRPA